MKKPIEQTGDGPGLLLGDKLHDSSTQRGEGIITEVVTILAVDPLQQELDLQSLKLRFVRTG
jgi:hypothetical protein